MFVESLHIVEVLSLVFFILCRIPCSFTFNISSDRCLPPWEHISNTRYCSFNTSAKMNFDNATAQCRLHEAKLFHFKTEKDYNDLATFLNKTLLFDERVWFGARARVVHGKRWFYWPDTNESLDVSSNGPFLANEPNNHGETNENCVEYWYPAYLPVTGPKGLNDIACNHPATVLCMKGIPCPTPKVSNANVTGCHDQNCSLEIRCHKFHVIDGPNRSTCSSQLDWYPPLPVCKNLPCPTPNVSNANVTGCHDQNCSLEIRCHRFHLIDGPNRSTCSPQLEWYPPLPVCKDLPCQAPNISNGNVSGCHEKSCTVHTRCHSYHVIAGNNRSTCTPQLEWHPSLPVCQALPCPFPNISNANVTGCHDQRCNVQIRCHSSYAIVGHNRSICTEQLEWRPPLPVCEDIPTPVATFRLAEVHTVLGTELGENSTNETEVTNDPVQVDSANKVDVVMIAAVAGCLVVAVIAGIVVVRLVVMKRRAGDVGNESDYVNVSHRAAPTMTSRPETAIRPGSGYEAPIDNRYGLATNETSFVNNSRNIPCYEEGSTNKMQQLEQVNESRYSIDPRHTSMRQDSTSNDYRPAKYQPEPEPEHEPEQHVYICVRE